MGFNLCWIQIRRMLSVWLETKAWTGNPYCINLRDQTPLSASFPPGSVRPGINPCAQAVSYGYRIQRWSCDMAPTPLCCCCGEFLFSLSLRVWHLMGVRLPLPRSPASLPIPGLGLLNTGPQRLLEAPGRGRR